MLDIKLVRDETEKVVEALKKRAEEVGVEAEVHAEKIGIKPANPEGLVNFFLRHLRAKATSP